MAAKKTAAKKTTAKKTAAKTSDPLAAIREDTPDPELTDLDRDTDACRYCGRDAVKDGLCEKHAARRGVS